jgi:cell wall-associated NlpC family hydrolase
MQFVYNNVLNHDISRTTYSQYDKAKQLGIVYSLSEAEPGDVLHRTGHVGMYLGNGYLVDIGQDDKPPHLYHISGESFERAFRFWKVAQ